jgi:hypothetical protein
MKGVSEKPAKLILYPLRYSAKFLKAYEKKDVLIKRKVLINNNNNPAIK